MCVDSTDPFAKIPQLHVPSSRALTLACTDTLGYPQPVEEKPLDDQTGDGSDSEDDQDNDDHDDNNNDDDDDDDSA